MKFRGKSCPRSCVVTWYMRGCDVRNMCIQLTDIFSASRWIYCDVCSLTPNPQLLLPVSSFCASSISPFWVPSAPWNFSDLEYPRQTGTMCWPVSVHFNNFSRKHEQIWCPCTILPSTSTFQLLGSVEEFPQVNSLWQSVGVWRFCFLTRQRHQVAITGTESQEPETRTRSRLLKFPARVGACLQILIAWLYCFTLWFTVFLLRHCLSTCFGSPALYWWLSVALSSNYFRCGEGHGRKSCIHTISGFSRHILLFFFKICGTTHMLTENTKEKDEGK